MKPNFIKYISIWVSIFGSMGAFFGLKGSHLKFYLADFLILTGAFSLFGFCIASALYYSARKRFDKQLASRDVPEHKE